MILKFLAVYISTLILVGQLGSKLGMPLRARTWLVVRAALVPLWSSISLSLHLLAALGTWLQMHLEEEPLSASFLASRAIGMYSTVALDVPDADQLRIAHRLPRYIPLSEALCFSYRDPSTTDAPNAGMPITLRTQKSKKGQWFNRVLAVLLTIIYLIQATATILLVARRSRLSSMIPSGPPFSLMNSAPEMAITPFEFQAMFLTMYGIAVALVFIVLQITHVEWLHVDEGQQWTYSADRLWSRSRRGLVGLCTYIMLNDAIGFLLQREVLSVMWTFYWGIVLGTMWSRLKEKPKLLLFLIIFLLVPTRIKWRTIGARLQRSRLWRDLPGPGWGVFSLAILNMWDYARQDFTEFDMKRYTESQGDTPSFTNVRTTSFRIHYFQAMYVYLALISLMILFLSFSTIFEKVDVLQVPAVSLSGCVFETELKAWMWKDPLADTLWAF